MFSFRSQLESATKKIQEDEKVSAKLAQRIAYTKTKTIKELDGSLSLDARALYVTDLLPDFIKYVQAKQFAHIDFTFNNSAFELLPSLLPLNQLKSLTLDNRTNSDPEEKLIDCAMIALQKTTSLKYIGFPCFSSAANMKKITAGVKANRSLSGVSFVLPHKGLEATKAIAENVINGNPRIERLLLDTSEGQFNTETLKIIIKALATNTTLKKLQISHIEELNDDLVRLLVETTNARKLPLQLSLRDEFRISPKGLEMLKASEFIGHISTGDCGLDTIYTKGGYRLEAESKASSHHATTFGTTATTALTSKATVVATEPSKQLVL